ncbi:MAG: GNAT family N-acetyltransferase [Lentimicrobium sp.]
MPEIILKLEHCTLRPFTWADAKSLAKYANHYQVAAFLRPSFPQPFTRKDAEEYIYFCMHAQDTIVLAIQVNDEAIGSIGVQLVTFKGKQTWELGYWIGFPFWHKGIMNEAVKNFVQYLTSYLKTNEIIAKVYNLNIASIKVLQNNGFVRINSAETTRIRTGQLAEEWVFIKKL